MATKTIIMMPIQLGVSRIEFDDHGKVIAIVGVNPKIRRLFGGDLTVVSTDKVVVNDGIAEFVLDGGRKLLLPLNSSLSIRINNADFLLDPQPKGPGAKQAEPGKYVSLIVNIDPSNSRSNDLFHERFFLEVTRMNLPGSPHFCGTKFCRPRLAKRFR